MDTVKVLLVDDEAAICQGLKSDFMKMQHPWEYQVFTAQSVPEAEDIYYREGADIVITDVHMPKGSGLLLISEMRKDNPLLGILVLSAYDNFEYVRNAFTMGADDYLLKPIAFSELDKKVRQLAVRVMEQSGRIMDYGKTETEASKRAACTMEETLEYIRMHIGEKLSAAEMAKKMAVSYGNFGKLFRNHTGMNFSAYVLNCRMEAAKEYLENPHIKIKQIAAKVGYHDNPQHFSRDFTRQTGLSPKEYRAQMLKNGAM